MFAPDLPFVAAGSFEPDMLNAGFVHRFVGLLCRCIAPVFGAVAYPQEPSFGSLCVRLRSACTPPLKAPM